MSRVLATAVLDSQGLSLWISGDRAFAAKMAVLHQMGTRIVLCANTIIEVGHAKTNPAKLHWALSQMRVEPVTEQTAKAAVMILRGAGLSGHKYAIDATVAEAALRQPKPVAIVTSDSDDMRRLCGTDVVLIPV